MSKQYEEARQLKREIAKEVRCPYHLVWGESDKIDAEREIKGVEGIIDRLKGEDCE